MDTKLKGAIDVLEEQLAGLIEQGKNLKRTINGLSVAGGEAAPYSDIDSPVTGQSRTILPDQFFGRGLVTAVKDYLKLKGRAAPSREIFDALKAGGFEFSAGDEKLQYRGFTISLSKSARHFVYVKPTDSWGLPEFYPGYIAKKERAKEKAQVDGTEFEEDDAAEQNDSLSDVDLTTRPKRLNQNNPESE